MSALHRFDLEKLRIDVTKGLRPLRITTHAQVEESLFRFALTGLSNPVMADGFDNPSGAFLQ